MLAASTARDDRGDFLLGAPSSSSSPTSSSTAALACAMRTRVHHGPSPPAAATAFHLTDQARSFVAFATVEFVQIYELAPSFPLRQTLRPPPTLATLPSQLTVTALAGHSSRALLAVAYNDGRVVLFSPVIPTGPADSDELCWTVAADLRRVDPPTALAWMRDSLVIAGRSIEALAPTTTASGAMAWTSGWSAKAGAMPPTTVLASPDGKAIAAYRNGDRIVKVWMANDGRPLSHQLVRPYSFHYLSHPAPVTSIAWRGRRDSLTLMANCSDATCRIWTFALKLKTFSLILSLSMPPLPAAAVAAAAAMHSHRGADPNLASFSWLGLARIAPRPKPPSFLSGEQPGSSGTDKRTDPELAELVTMYDELVIGAAADGSVRVWGISNLDRRQGPPAAHLLKHHPNCLRASHFKSFHSLQIIQHAFSPTPEHLLILGKAQSGILSVYSVLVGHLIYHPNTKIRLVHEWAGHTRAAVPASDLVGAGPRDDPRRQPARASAQGKWLVTSTGGETMVWNPGERNMGMRQLKGLWMRRHRTATSAADATEWVVPTDTTDAGDVVVRRDRVQCGTAQAPLEGAPLDATVHTSSDGTRVASIVTTGGVHRYTVPSLLGAGEAGVPLPRLPTTLGTLVSRGMDACPYLAVTVHESTVRVHGLDGAVLVQHERVMVPVDGGDTKKQLIGAANVLQVAAANHTLVLRTPTALHIFSLGWVDHALVHEQTILDRCTATAVLGLPTGAVLLAAARDHLVHVHVRQVVSATESGWDLTSRWVVAATATMPGFVDAVAWTHQADLVAISGSAVVAVDAVPTLAELALRAAVPAPDSPAILREWLRWNRPDVVRAVFNQKYYALKGTDGGGGDMGMPAMTWPAIEKAAGLAPHNEGSSGGTSAADALAAELENLFASGGMDSDDSPAMDTREAQVFSNEKAQFLRQHFTEAKGTSNTWLLAILDAIMLPESASLDRNGQRLRWELLLYFHAIKNGLTPTALPPESIAFGFFSDDQPALVELISNSCNLTWETARRIGCGWWLTHPDALRTFAEVVSRNHWRKANNPHDCFLYYLALGKRKLMQTLWKQASGHPEQQLMSNFLSQEPSDKWRKSAAKNAFVLLGKQRFELAACFFLLAESNADAVTVCIRNLRDPQLALLLVKLLGEPVGPVLQQIRTMPPPPPPPASVTAAATSVVMTGMPTQQLAPSDSTAAASQIEPDLADPSYMIMCSWLTGTRVVDMASVTSPAAFLLLQAVEHKLSSQFLASAAVPWTARRHAISRAVMWYQTRGAPHFARLLLHELPSLEEPTTGIAADDAAAKGEDDFMAMFGDSAETKPRDTAEAPVDDDFAAMFGGLSDGPPAARANDDFDALFGGGDSSAPAPPARSGGDAFDALFGSDPPADDFSSGQSPTTVTAVATDTDPKARILLDAQERHRVERADHLLGLWALVQSIFTVQTTAMATDPFFADFVTLSETLGAARADPAAAALTAPAAESPASALPAEAPDAVVMDQLCWLALAPNHAAHLGQPPVKDMVLALVFRLLVHVAYRDAADALMDEPLRALYLKTDMDCIATLVRLADTASKASVDVDGGNRPGSPSFDVESVFLAGVVPAMLVLAQVLIARCNYRAVGVVIKHFAALLATPRTSAAEMQAMLASVVPHLSDIPSSRHLVLEYLTLRMARRALEDLTAEHMASLTADSAHVLVDICIPYVTARARQVHDEVIRSETLVQSPVDDWLPAAQQELLEALVWEPSWVAELKAPRVDISLVLSSAAAAGQSAPDAVAAPLSLEHGLLKLAAQNAAAKQQQLTDASTGATAVSMPVYTEPPYAPTIDVLLKQEHAIYAMALAQDAARVLVGMHRGAMEVHAERSVAAAQRGGGMAGGAGSPPSEMVASSSSSTAPAAAGNADTISVRSGTSTLALEPPAIVAQTSTATISKQPAPGSTTATTSSTLTAAGTTMSSMGAALLKNVQISRRASDSGAVGSAWPATGIAAENGVVATYPATYPHLATHSALNYFVVSDHVDSNSYLALHQYGGRGELMRVAYGSAKINRLAMDAVGGRVAVADSAGEVSVLGLPSCQVYANFPCHSRYTSDVTFYGSSTLFVSAGSSPGHTNNVALWDALLPVHSARVRGYDVHESGASAVAYDGRLVYSGGKKGDISVMDMRYARPLCTLSSAHDSTIACLALAAPGGTSKGTPPILYSGSTDGSLKVWDLSTPLPTLVAAFKALHTPRKFLAVSAAMPVSSVGITQILVGDGYVVTCGGDGAVRWLH